MQTTQPSKKGMSLNKKIAVVAIIAIILVPGSFFGLLYYQFSSLQVGVTVQETQVVNWLLAILSGRSPQLVVTLSFTNPTFLTVDATDIYVQLYIEDEYVLEESISTLYIPPHKTINKDLTFTIGEGLTLYDKVNRASNTYGGEVKIGISGVGTAHLFFLSARLHFSTSRYYMIKEPHLKFLSARWTDSSGNTIASSTIGGQAYIEVKLMNPTRSQTVTDSVTIRVMRTVRWWFDEKMMEDSDSITLSPGSTGTVTFMYSPSRSGEFHFDVFFRGDKVYTSPDIKV